MSTNQIQDMANKKKQEDHEYTTSSKKQTSELLDPVEMLQNPRLRLYIACIVAVTPFIVSGLLFVSSLDSVALQFLLGAVLGLLLTFSYQLIALYRTHLRNIKVVQVAQMSRLDANSLKEILPTEESFPSWIKFYEFEKLKIYLHRCWVLA